MLRLIQSLIVILAVVIGLAFGFFNYSLTDVDLLWTTTEAPLSVLLGLSFLLGLVVALLVCGLRMVSLRRRLSRTRRQLKNAEDELSSWRHTPHTSA